MPAFEIGIEGFNVLISDVLFSDIMADVRQTKTWDALALNDD